MSSDITVQIDKGVPIPKPRAERVSYPWREMEVGDSIFIPGKTSLQSNAASTGKRTGRKFTSRVLVENGVRGVRIWRIA